MRTFSIQKQSDLHTEIQKYWDTWSTYPLWLLQGPLGVGKTTFVKALVRILDPTYENVRSPSFSLLHTYYLENMTMYHADFYRIDKADLSDFGYEDWLGREKTLGIVEWAEKLVHIPDIPHIHFSFSFGEHSARTITLNICQSGCS